MRRAALLLPLLLAACNTTQQAALPATPFNASEADYIKTAGKATIEGHAFLKDKSGTVKVAAGEVVRLVPASSYAQARFAHFYGGAKFVAAASIPKIEPDPNYAAYTRTTKTESNGRFTFDKVAPGHYYVTTQLIWEGKEGALFKQGGAFYEDVNVTSADVGPVKVVLSGN
jgi:hypothetical protein